MAYYEEYKEIPQFWVWALVVGFSLSFFAAGFVVHSMVMEKPDYWDFGELPDVPAESEYSSLRYIPYSDPKEVPRQVEPLPESRPLQGGQSD